MIINPDDLADIQARCRRRGAELREEAHRYQLTAIGLRTVLFYSRTLNRVIPPGLSQIAYPNFPRDSSKLTAAFRHLETELTNYLAEKKAA